MNVVKRAISKLLYPSRLYYAHRTDRTDKKIDELGRQLKGIEQQLALLEKNLGNMNACLSGISADLKDQKQLNAKADRNDRLSHEILWAQIFNSTINDSGWLSHKVFSPGRWAVGYHYLYVLFRTLNDVHPQSVLELGLGQTTKMISQYAAHTNARHDVVEHDEKWLDFFKNEYELPKETNIIKMELTERSYLDDDTVVAYKDFKKVFQSKRYNLISIDGPFGGTVKTYARVDLLDLLPDCLCDDFVILMDDYNRKSEQNTIELMKNALVEHGVAFQSAVYRGVKDVCILTSASLGFLCTL